MEYLLLVVEFIPDSPNHIHGGTIYIYFVNILDDKIVGLRGNSEEIFQLSREKSPKICYIPSHIIPGRTKDLEEELWFLFVIVSRFYHPFIYPSIYF